VTDRIVVPARFNGPDGSGNGGYVAGLLAAQAVGVSEVTLRRPPPLETPLDVRRGDNGVELYDGPSFVAQAVPAEFDVEVPEPVDVEVAERASASYAGLAGHPFPRCFVCGPDRPDGLRIFPGLVPGRGVVAAPWRPAAEFANPKGEVREEFVSAALDCTGGWSLDISAGRPLVLGRFAVRAERPVAAGQPHVVMGWPLGVDGRKLYAATALLSAAGETLAVATATWIAIEAVTARE
jgi:hypothetical protein